VNGAPLLAPDDDDVIAPAVLRRVVNSLTSRDLGILERLEREKRIDVELVDADASTLLWMGHFGLFGVDVDFADRTYLVRRPEGKAAIDERQGRTSEPRRRRGRRPMETR